jgi:hypothetical protein
VDVPARGRGSRSGADGGRGGRDFPALGSSQPQQAMRTIARDPAGRQFPTALGATPGVAALLGFCFGHHRILLRPELKVTGNPAPVWREFRCSTTNAHDWTRIPKGLEDEPAVQECFGLDSRSFILLSRKVLPGGANIAAAPARGCPSRCGSTKASAWGLAHPVFPSHPLRVGRPARRVGCGCAALGPFVV